LLTLKIKKKHFYFLYINKKRNYKNMEITNFKMFKEQYLHLNENEEVKPEETMPEMGNSEAEPKEGEPETEEESDLVKSVRATIENSYSETLTDMIKGINGELEEDLDVEDVIDAILDVLEDKIEEILNPQTEEGEGGEGNDEQPTETEGEPAPEPVQEKKKMPEAFKKYLEERKAKKKEKDEKSKK
jgi:hypothetical protein